MKDAKGQEVCTTDGRPGEDADRSLRADGQQKDYVVLCDTERAKGFLRPVRTQYRHVARRPPQCQDYKRPEGVMGGPCLNCGRPQPEHIQLIEGCGAITTMGQALAETYARDPKFYSGTFCARCGSHFPVGEYGEFEWLDGSKVGT